MPQTDTIYVATNAGVLHALNPTTGADVWTFSGAGPYTGETDLSTSPLVLPQGSILWPGPADTLYELSPAGQLLWSHRFDGMVLSPHWPAPPSTWVSCRGRCGS